MGFSTFLLKIILPGDRRKITLKITRKKKYFDKKWIYPILKVNASYSTHINKIFKQIRRNLIFTIEKSLGPLIDLNEISLMHPIQLYGNDSPCESERDATVIIIKMIL